MKFIVSVAIVFSMVFSGAGFSILSGREVGEKFGLKLSVLLGAEAIAATPAEDKLADSISENNSENQETNPLTIPSQRDIGNENNPESPCREVGWWERFFPGEIESQCQGENERLKAQKYGDAPEEPLRDRDDDDLLPSRGQFQVSENIPYIISPRRTLLLNPRPTIRWNPVENATSYTVIIKGGAGYVWQTEVKENEVIYSGSSPLESGVYYTIIVDANTGESSLDDEMPEQGFETIGESDRLRVKNAATEIEATTEEEKSLRLARLYRENNLRSEAIAILEKLANNGSETTAVYQMLEKLYQEIGLANLADKYAQKAVELANKEDAE